MTKKLQIITFTTFFMGMLFAGVLSAQNNQAVIDSLCRSMALEQFAGLQADSLALDIQKIAAEYSGYLNIVIGNTLANEGYKIKRNFAGGQSFQESVFEIYKFDALIVYSRPKAKTFLGKTYVTRRIITQLQGQIYNNKSGQIMRAVKAEKSFEDEIAYDEIENFEKSDYNFTRGIRSDVSDWQKYFEPALVMTTVALIIYLFFSQRT